MVLRLLNPTWYDSNPIVGRFNTNASTESKKGMKHKGYSGIANTTFHLTYSEYVFFMIKYKSTGMC